MKDRIPNLAGRNITVAGLGHFGGGVAVTRWLVAQGARVLVTDLNPAEKLTDSLNQIEDVPVRLHLGGHSHEHFTQTDMVVASPAVPPHSEFLQAATSAGVPVTTEMALFVERCRGQVIAITGTKGKSTTTAMIHHILSACADRNVGLGGNIGASLLADVDNIAHDDIVVLELSSFMLHYLGPMRFAPAVSVTTMLGSDHLSWHGSRDAYLDAKANILRHQSPQQTAVLNRDNADCMKLSAISEADKIWFGRDEATGIDISLPGEHNRMNAAAALAACATLGIARDAALQSLQPFKGLPHRLQPCGQIKGVKFVNDSIATNPEAAVAALHSFPPGTVIQIIGGADKQLDMTPLCDALRERAKAVLCIGQLGESLAERIGDKAGNAGTLDAAFSQAVELTERGDVILLSPGCASYGQFSNFTERGEAFARLVEMWEANHDRD